jgi:hypothetical protein
VLGARLLLLGARGSPPSWGSSLTLLISTSSASVPTCSPKIVRQSAALLPRGGDGSQHLLWLCSCPQRLGRARRPRSNGPFSIWSLQQPPPPPPHPPASLLRLGMSGSPRCSGTCGRPKTIWFSTTSLPLGMLSSSGRVKMLLFGAGGSVSTTARC